MPTKEHGWVHSACALWTPQTFMGQQGVIENIPRIGKVRNEVEIGVVAIGIGIGMVDREMEFGGGREH